MDSLPEDLAKKPEISRARAAFEVASGPTADTSGLEARVAANGDDHEARLELANAQMAAGDRDVPPLNGWRMEAFGADALRLCRGEIALSAKGNNVRVVTL